MPDPRPPYLPPQPAFRRCRCGALVLREHGQVVSPCLGLPHHCPRKAGKMSDAALDTSVLLPASELTGEG